MTFEVSHPRILNFYNNNSCISFEKVNLLLIDLFENVNMSMSSYEKCGKPIINNIEEMVKQNIEEIVKQNIEEMYKKNTHVSSENQIVTKSNELTNTNTEIFNILNQLYTSSEIFKNNMYNSDYYIMKRISKSNILIESTNIYQNVSVDEIKCFIQKIEEHNCNGILISQNSGISTKSNFYIENYKGNVIVYIHNANYCHNKIKMAITMLDVLSDKLTELTPSNQSIFQTNISKDILDEINNEYQLFIINKENIINMCKENHKKLLSQLDELLITTLDKFLSTKFKNNIKKPVFKCDMCNIFNGNNLKALAAHKRGCNRKNIVITNHTMVNHNSSNLLL